MAKRQGQYDDIRRDVEEVWESWPERKQPRSDTQNMFEFYQWLSYERPDLADFKRTVTDECWQRIKSWLIGYEERRGRSIYYQGPSFH